MKTICDPAIVIRRSFPGWRGPRNELVGSIVTAALRPSQYAGTWSPVVREIIVVHVEISSRSIVLTPRVPRNTIAFLARTPLLSSMFQCGGYIKESPFITY